MLLTVISLYDVLRTDLFGDGLGDERITRFTTDPAAYISKDGFYI